MTKTEQSHRRARAENATRSMVEGPIMGSLIKMAVPIVCANMLQTAYQLVDAFWVGRLGEGAVAAVSTAFPVLFFLISLGGGLAVAGSAFVAQNAGARKFDAVNHVAGQTFLMVLVVAIFLSVTGYFIVDPLLNILNVPADVYADAGSYLSVSVIGVVFMFIFFIFEAVLRGMGETRFPLLLVGMTVGLNLVLDPLLIFGWGSFEGFGVTGAAYATLITQALAAAVGIGVLFSNRFGIQLSAATLKPDFPFMKKAFLIGFPASIEQSSRAMGLLMMTALVNSFGSTSMAIFGTGFRFLTFVIIPALGLSMATAALVGQNLGAGNPERADQVGRLAGRVAFVMLTAVGVLFFLFATPLVAFFVPDSPEVIREGAYFLRIMAFSLGFMGWQQALLGAFRGAGATMFTMAQAIFSLWLVQLPIAYILSKHTPLGVEGIWWSFPVVGVASWAFVYFWYCRGSWKKARLTDDERFEAKVRDEIVIEEGM